MLAWNGMPTPEPPRRHSSAQQPAILERLSGTLLEWRSQPTTWGYKSRRDQFRHNKPACVSDHRVRGDATRRIKSLSPWCSYSVSNQVCARFDRVLNLAPALLLEP